MGKSFDKRMNKTGNFGDLCDWRNVMRRHELENIKKCRKFMPNNDDYTMRACRMSKRASLESTENRNETI